MRSRSGSNLGVYVNFRALANNASIAFVSQGVSMMLSIVVSFLVPKVLDLTGFGYWQLFLFYSSYAGLFHFGLNDGVYLITGGVSRERLDRKSINSQLLIGTLIQIVVALSLFALAVVLPIGEERSFVLKMSALYVILFNLTGFLGFLFQAMNETRLYSLSVIVSRISFAVPLVVLILLRESNYANFVIAQVVSQGIGLAYCIWNAREVISAGWMPMGRSLRLTVQTMSVGVKLMLSNLASMLILGIVRFTVDARWGIEAFGTLSFALSMVTFFLGFMAQISMVLFPALRQANQDEWLSVFRAIRELFVVVLPAAYLIYAPLSSVLAAWLPQYSSGLIYFALFLPICVFETQMDILSTTYFKVLRREHTLLIINVVSVLMSAGFTAVGVLLFDSIWVVVLCAVCVIVARSVVSQWIVSRTLGEAQSSFGTGELMMTLSFLVLSSVCTPYQSMLIYSGLYFVFVAFNRKLVLRSVGRLRRLAE